MYPARQVEKDEGLATLISIVALLLSLADIARRAASLPPEELYRMLWILRPAAAVAQQMVIDEMLPGAEDISTANLLCSDGPEDALRLAATLQMAGLMLGTLAEQIAASIGLNDAAEQISITGAPVPSLGIRPAHHFTGHYPDTS